MPDISTLAIRVTTSGISQATSELARLNSSAASAASGVTSIDRQMAGLISTIRGVVAAIGGMYAIRTAFSTWFDLIQGGVGAVDDYRRSIISGAAALTNLTDTKFQPDLKEAYGAWKDYFQWLWTQSIEADKKVAASGREIFETSKELAKRGVVASTAEQVEIAGRLTDFIKSVSPMTAGDGGMRNMMQIQQEIRSMLEGEVRMGAQVAQQMQVIDPLFKEHMNTARQTGTVYEYLNKLLEGQKQATQDMANTWESVYSSLKAVWQQVQIRAFGQAYDDVVMFGKTLISTLIEGGDLTARGKTLADALGNAWSEAKNKIAELFNYMVDNFPEVVGNVQAVASAMGTIASYAAAAIVKIAELLTQLRELSGNPLVQMLLGGALGSRLGPVGAAVGAVAYPGSQYLASGAGPDASYGFGALLPEQKQVVPSPRYGTESYGHVSDAIAPKNAPLVPPVRPFTGKSDGGGGGRSADAEARRLMSIYDTLQKDIARLSEGSWAEIDANLEKTLDQIYNRQEVKIVALNELEVMAYKRAQLQKEQAGDKFYKSVLKEAGDTYGQIDEWVKESLKNFPGEQALVDWAASRKYNEQNFRDTEKVLDIQKEYLSNIASGSVLLANQLNYEKQALVIDNTQAQNRLNRMIDEQRLNDYYRERYGLQALMTPQLESELRLHSKLSEQLKAQALQRKEWQTQGVLGGLNIANEEAVNNASTYTAKATADYFRNLPQELGSGIANWMVATAKGQKTSFEDLGWSMAAKFLEATYTGLIQQIMPMITTMLKNALGGQNTSIPGGNPFSGLFSGLFGGMNLGEVSNAGAGSYNAFNVTGAGDNLLFSLIRHSGGMLYAHSGLKLAPDEVPFIGLTGERVLNRQQTLDYEQDRYPAVTFSPNISVENNSNSAQADVQTQPNGDIVITIDDLAAKAYSRRGALHKIINNDPGITRR